MRGTTRWIALLLALTLVAAACGDDDGGSAFGGGSDGGIEAFCDLAQQQEDLDQSVNGGEVNIFEPDEFRAAFEELADLTDRAADIAPDEIRADFEILRDGLDDVRDQLEGVDYDITAIDEEDFVDTEEQNAASDRIEAFVEEECGIVDSGAELSDEQLEEQLGESGAAGGLIAEAFVEAGLPQDQADCLAERVTFEELLAFGEASADGAPPAEFFDALDACGVSIDQLAELGAMGGEDLGDMDLGEELGEESVEDLLDDMGDMEPGTGGDLPPEAVDLFVSTLVDQGFTEEEARCLAGPILDDPANADPLQAFEDCGISLSRLAELGG